MGKRKINAFVFDFFLLILLFLPGVPFFIHYLGMIRDAYYPHKIAALKASDPTLDIVLYYWLALVFVFIGRDLLPRQSPGKKRAGIVVMQVHDQPARTLMLIARNFILLYTWPVELFYLNDERTLPDKLLGTKIVLRPNQ